MQFVRGMVVRSKAGHDKGRFFVVTAAAETMVLLRGRHDDKVHRKNPIHLAPTKTVLREEQLSDDREIRNILAVFDSGTGHS